MRWHCSLIKNNNYNNDEYNYNNDNYIITVTVTIITIRIIKTITYNG